LEQPGIEGDEHQLSVDGHHAAAHVADPDAVDFDFSLHGERDRLVHLDADVAHPVGEDDDGSGRKINRCLA
jgi:hypothetical protein